MIWKSDDSTVSKISSRILLRNIYVFVAPMNKFFWYGTFFENEDVMKVTVYACILLESHYK